MKTEPRRVRAAPDCRKLDELPAFARINTTTEQVALHVLTLLAVACRDGAPGEAGRAVTGLKVLLRETPNAWAAYAAPIV